MSRLDQVSFRLAGLISRCLRSQVSFCPSYLSSIPSSQPGNLAAVGAVGVTFLLLNNHRKRFFLDLSSQAAHLVLLDNNKKILTKDP